MHKKSTSSTTDKASASMVSPPRAESTALLCGHKVLEIGHAGQRYLLRVTRDNKLILTK